MSDHGYKVDTVIHLHLSIGFSVDRKDRVKLGELIGMDQEELDSSSKSSIDDVIHEAMQEWSLNYIDMGWSVGGEPWAGE